MDIILVHGYNVTSTKTYGLLPLRLKNLGHSIKDVYLSKYVTLDDDLTITDLVQAFQAALVDVFGANLEKKKWACITHSTGGLVVRDWISTYYADRFPKLPISHLIMMAPPTHGSRLAELGKSRLSRLRSLWGVEPGVKILDSLELGSAYQWRLNSHWLAKNYQRAPGFFPAIVTGQWIDKTLWDAIVPATYERGSDGVVRAASANFNMRKLILGPDGYIAKDVIDDVPYLVVPKTSHSDERFGIIASAPEKGEHPTLEAILSVLAVNDNRAYKKLAEDFAKRTAGLQGQEQYFDGSPLNRYCQMIFRILDHNGAPLSDYAIELVDATRRGDQMPSGFMADKHKNGAAPEHFTYYLNYDRLKEVRGGRLGVRIQSVTHSPLVEYKELEFAGFANVDELVRPNETTYVEVRLKRRLNKNIFRLTKDFSYQKIKGQPADDWIE